MNLFYKIFINNNNTDFTSSEVRQRIIVNFFSTLGIIAFVGFGIEGLFKEKYLLSSILFSANLFTIGVIIISKKTKKINLSANLMVGVLFVVCLFLIYKIAKEDKTAILWLYIFPPTALFAVGKKKGLILTFLLFSISFLILLTIDELKNVYDIFYLSRYITTLMIITLLSFSFEYIREKTFDAFVDADNKKNDYLDEIKMQKGKIERKKLILEHALKDIKQKNEQITDSIIYAERIQKAILPTNEMISQSFADYFILFKPKDIVSGDFYWHYRLNNSISLIAAIDCTGHGVPGAFMSLIGYSLLEHIMGEYNKETTGEILDKLKILLINRLSKQNKNINDGMDMALLMIDKEKQQLQYSGAYNPLIQIRTNETTVYKGNNFPIGRYFKEINKPFKTHIIEYQKDDKYYIFSDGYIDQLNEQQEEKYTLSRLKEKLLAIQDLSFENQKNELNNTIEKWIGNYKQIDDIIVVGISL